MGEATVVVKAPGCRESITLIIIIKISYIV